MLTIISALIFYYVILINTNATLGYDIRDLEDIQRNLILEEELLDVKIAELESLTNILKDNATDTMETEISSLSKMMFSMYIIINSIV